MSTLDARLAVHERDQRPHFPPPPRLPVVAPLPAAGTIPLRIAILPAHLPLLQKYEDGQRGEAILFAVKAVVNTCGAVVSGVAPAVRNGRPAIVLLTPVLRATLLAMYGRSTGWSDPTIEAVWQKLEPLVFPTA